MTDHTYVYRRNSETGEVHRFALVDGALLTPEGDNVDDAKRLVDMVEFDALKDIAETPRHACGNCFPLEDPE